MRPQDRKPINEETPIPGLDQLIRERRPSTDLWAGIEARLPTRQRRRNPWPYALAASLCVATFTGLLLHGTPTPNVQPERVQVQVASIDPQPSLNEVREPDTSPGSGLWTEQSRNGLANSLASGLPRQVRTLRSESWEGLPAGGDAMPAAGSGLVAVNYRPSSSDAGLERGHHGNGGSQRALLRANLKLVGTAERELRRALRADPDSEALQDMLASAQQHRQSLNALMLAEAGGHD